MSKKRQQKHGTILHTIALVDDSDSPDPIASYPPCPVCGGLIDGGQPRLEHKPGCSHYAGLQRVSRLDRRYFEKHPTAQTYVRPMHRTEVAELAMETGRIRELLDGEIIASPSATVRVTQIKPGLRIREPEDFMGWIHVS